MALILVLIFTVLLYALVAELVTRARTDRLTGQNDALLARMQRHMDYSLTQVEEMLLTDLQAGAAADESGGEGGGPLGGLGGAGAGGAAGAAGAGDGAPPEEEPEASAIADCSQDAWFEPSAYADNDLTTYVWVEDENRKFNILTLASPDEEFARESRQRFVRILDALRQDTDFDLSIADAETIADRVVEWIDRRTDTEALPKPQLKSDLADRPQLAIPMHLDELMMLRGVSEDLFFDKVLDSRLIPGLESVLTIYTALRFDPGDPERTGNRPQPGQQPGGQPGAQQPGGQPAAGDAATSDPLPVGSEDVEPEGVGIRININTAPRAVLRGLFTTSEIPDSVIDAILRYRNEPVEDENGEPQRSDEYLQHVEEAVVEQKKVFTEVEQLDDIPEFQNLPDPAIKQRFYELVTTESDVFSVHMASMFRRNEENRVFVMSRRRSILVRIDDGEEGLLHPLILQEERTGLRVMPVDVIEDEIDRIRAFDELDDFSQEERAWNPFYLDFYRPQYERDQLFTYRDRR